MKVLNSIIGTLVVVSASAFSAPSEATPFYKILINHAVAACRGTTDTFDDMLKVRSQGMNNGTTNKMTVINCGGVATPSNGNAGDVVVYEAGITNLGNSPITVNCSLVDGLADAITGVATLYPRTVTVPVGGVVYIDWNGMDTGGTQWNNGAYFYYPSMQCQLPPSAEVSYTAIIYDENSGY